MEKIHYSVDGLVNSESKTKLKNSLDKIDGVHGINVDIARGTVEVEYKSPASPDQIKGCIRKTGYDVHQ